MKCDSFIQLGSSVISSSTLISTAAISQREFVLRIVGIHCVYLISESVHLDNVNKAGTKVATRPVKVTF